MKRFIFMLAFLATFCLSAHSQATGLSDLKFSKFQIADSQWNVSAGLYTATCQIYSKQPGTAYKIPWTSGQLSWATGDYVSFVKTGNATNPWNAIQYNSAGVQKAVMGAGHIINMGADFFFFVGSDNNTGQLFSVTTGMNSTAGVTWTGTLNPSVTQVDTLAATNGSTTPLAAGQTAAPAAPAAAKAWWDMLQKQFNQVAAATAATLRHTDNQPASKKAPTKKTTTSRATKKTATKRATKKPTPK